MFYSRSFWSSLVLIHEVRVWWTWANLPESTLRTSQSQTQQCESSPSYSLKRTFKWAVTQSVQLTEIGPQACIPGQEASPEEASLIFSHHSHDRHHVERWGTIIIALTITNTILMIVLIMIIIQTWGSSRKTLPRRSPGGKLTDLHLL